jgi:hypothetical protein
MAVDFSLLPPEEPLPDDPPSRLVWPIVFVVMTLAGVLAVLLLWPKNLPTNTWKFWTSLILFPVGVPALIVLCRFSCHEGRKLDVELRNEATRKYNGHVFDLARFPFALVGAAYRFSGDQAKQSIESIRNGAVTLTTQEPVAREGEATKARWLVVPKVELKPGTKEDDRNRHRKVTEWLFAEMLDELAPQIHVLPTRLGLRVHLISSNELTHLENVELWQACWRERQFRPADVAVAGAEFETLDLMTLDHWLDQVNEGRCREVKLIVATQLHPLLSGTPPAGTAEAGASVLLVPHMLASRHEMQRMANLHRPVRGPFDVSNGALSHTLKWANVTAAEIPGGWQTGLDATQAGALREPAVKLGLTAPATDLDQTVGHTGVAAPWLAVACAAASLSGDAASEIVFAGNEDTVDCAVLRRGSGERAAESAAARSLAA